MNKNLISKLLARLTLKDLYDEVRVSEQSICVLGMILATKKPTLFAQIIRGFIENVVLKGNDKELESFLKTEIISMDASEEVSINKTVKKASVKKPPVEPDPCFHGVGRGAGPSC